MTVDVSRARKSRTGWWAVLAVIAVTVVIGFALDAKAQREQDARSDVYYCTLSGVGLFDRGPNTGRTCLDLLSD